MTGAGVLFIQKPSDIRHIDTERGRGESERESECESDRETE